MSKILRVLVNTGKQETQKIYDIIQGAGAKGKPTILKAELGARYELQDPAAKDLGPANIQSKRVGKNKHVIFDDSTVADLIIEDYYEDGMGSFGDSGLYGRAEDGKLYEYIAKDSLANGLPVDLVDGGNPLTHVLGGSPANDVIMVSSSPAVAFSGINTLFAAAGTTGAVAAAAASDGNNATDGDGGGGDGDTTAPTGQTGGLAAVSDTGTRGDNITNSTTPTIDGRAEPGAAVEVTLNGKTYSTTANVTTGAYSVSVPLTDALGNGTYTPSIKVTDAAGNSSTVAGTTFTVDAAAPSGQSGALSNTAPNDSGTLGDNITSTRTPEISGTAEPGAAVEVTLNGKTYATTANATTGAYRISVPLADALGNGTYTPSIKVTDAAGNSGTVAGTAFTVDLNAPTGQTGGLAAVSDTGTRGDNITNSTTPQISGTAEAGATVEVTLNGKTYSTTANATTGAYRISVPLADALGNGTYTPSIKVTDAAGNSGTVAGAAFTVDLNAPTGQTGGLAAVSDTGTRGDNITNSTTPQISGTAEAGATVEVTLNGKTYSTTANATTGAYSISVPLADALGNGTYTPSIKVTDAAGNSGTVNGTAFTVDASAPTGQAGELTSSSDTGARDYITSTTTPQISGTAEPGAAVEVTLNGKTYATTANATTGAYSVTVPLADALGNGTYTPSIRVTDAAGNSSTAPGTAFTVNTNVPSGQTGGLTAAAPNDSGTLGDNITSTTTPEISGTAQAGAAVEVTLNGKTYATTANATTGAYRISVPLADALGNGTYTPSIKVTDAAGNSSTVAGTAFTVDATAPSGQSGALTNTAPNDSGALGDNLTRTNTPEVSGTAEPGASVEVTLNGKTYATTAHATTGAYSVTVPLADALGNGTHTPSIQVTDAAGNTSTVTGTAFTVDTDAPTGQTGALTNTASNDSGALGDNITSTSTPEISGTAQAGAAIEVTLNGKTYSTTAHATTGAYSVTVPLADALGNGTYTPSIKVTDAAGNSSTVAGTAFTVDATAPSGQTGALTNTAPNDSGALGDNLTRTTTPEISGTAEPGASVEVTLNGKTYATTAHATTGAYSVSVPLADALGNGTYTPSIQVTDAAGNTSTVAGTAFTIDTFAPTGQTGRLTATAPNDSGTLGDNITSTTTPQINGTAEAGAAVEVTLNGKTYSTTAHATTGAYSVSVPLADALGNGSYTPSIKVTDAAGNSSTVNGTTFAIDAFAVAITSVETNAINNVEQFESVAMYPSGGVINTSYVRMTYSEGSTQTTDQLTGQIFSHQTVDTGNSIGIGSSNIQLSSSDFSLFVDLNHYTFTSLSFMYKDLQQGVLYAPSAETTTAATVQFLNGSGAVIGTQALFAVTDNSVTPTFTWNNTTSAVASSFRIVGLTNDQWFMDKLSFTSVAGALGSGSTTTDTSPVLNGTLGTALSGSQYVEIFDGATSLGNATVSGMTWTFNVPAASYATHTYTAQVKDGTQVLSTSSNFTLIVAATPLVLDLNGDGVQTISVSEGTQFDLLNTGTQQSVGWVDRHDGLLAIDLNGDGHINSGAELFGDHMQLPNGSLAKDGWHALAAMDSNADGQINAQDEGFDRLLVWVDANGNGTSDAGELSTLAATHIASIDLAANNHSVQQNGNVVQYFSTYTTLDGRTHEVADVGFQVNPAVFASHGMDAGQLLVDPAMLNASRPML